MNSFVRDFELKPGELVTASPEGFKRTQVIQNPKKLSALLNMLILQDPTQLSTETNTSMKCERISAETS